ncbi:MAG: NusG domain II-containing protein, partial [Spirochaetaceae bacterium]|nr:NusG domain II-containing protein [Spirochaetaceae bacterium]
DYFIILFSLAIITASVYWSSAGDGVATRVEIEASGEVYVLPLSHEGFLNVNGPVGTTRVEVADGEVYITDSDCRDNICVSMGRISSSSSWIACLPNRVFVRVVAGDMDKEAEVDTGAF